MGYLHIENLYKNQAVLAGAECYALEKIHGTSAHISFKQEGDNPNNVKINFFSGGEKHETFVQLFDEGWLKSVATEMMVLEFIPGLTPKSVIVYGEAYGGKCQRMANTYGPDLKFVAFDVKLDDAWLDVPKAARFVNELGLDFVDWCRCSTALPVLDNLRDADSVQAIRNGMGPGKMREGIVIRPLVESVDHRGNRIIAKHKRDEFRETKSPRVVTEPSVEIVNAQKAAVEFVTPMRLEHVLDKMPGHSIEQMRDIINAMVEDVLREGANEVSDSPALRKAIAHRTAIEYKQRLKNQLV